MPAPAWENPDDFLDLDEFGTAAVLLLADGSERPVVGIYDNPYLNAELGEFDLDTIRPRFLSKESSLRGADRGDQLRLDDTGEVLDVLAGAQSTGDGFAVLELAATG